MIGVSPNVVWLQFCVVFGDRPNKRKMCEMFLHHFLFCVVEKLHSEFSVPLTNLNIPFLALSTNVIRI